jgi:hypothetical protein
MGHERLGVLPKTKPWTEIVDRISATARGKAPVAVLADRTLEQVRDRFSKLKSDPSTQGIFTALIEVAVACRGSDDAALRALLETSEAPTPLVLARRIHSEAELHEGAPEYAEITASAAADALAEWYDKSRAAQASLFESLRNPFETWRGLSTGSGFCELSRLFFAKSTERYLNYFLDRAASEVAPDIQSREVLRQNVRRHIADTSQHAFETAKITQSFAAGWFNKHAHEAVPDREAIRSFVSYAFDKMREALAREASGG